jgi:tRNA(Ile)-lysidine synthase
LLLLANTIDRVTAAATVDHRLRPESAEDARAVADLCAELRISHTILRVTVPAAASLQAQARTARYAALADWAIERKLDAILTAHHADDQAETLLMRLGRGAGLSGLSGVRANRALAPKVSLIRPLLAWRKAELVALLDIAGLTAATDPANSDSRHDRTVARAWLSDRSLDPLRLARSAAHLGDAEAALDWTARRLANERLRETDEGLDFGPIDLPDELARRVLLIAIGRLGDPPPRGPDLARALGILRGGARCTLGRLVLTGGERWTIRPAPPRR